MQKFFSTNLAVDEKGEIIEMRAFSFGKQYLAPEESPGETTWLRLNDTESQQVFAFLEELVEARRRPAAVVQLSKDSPVKKAKTPKIHVAEEEEEQPRQYLSRVVEEQCSYGSKNLQCGRMSKDPYPFCPHHLHVVSNKFLERKNLKRSRSGSDTFDIISYEGILDNSPEPRNVTRQLFP